MVMAMTWFAQQLKGNLSSLQYEIIQFEMTDEKNDWWLW